KRRGGLAPPVSEPLWVGPRSSTWVARPSPSRWTNQALPPGPSRRTSAAEAASMIAEGSQRFRARYRQVRELGQTAFRSAQRSATGLSGSLRPPALSVGG